MSWVSHCFDELPPGAYIGSSTGLQVVIRRAFKDVWFIPYCVQVAPHADSILVFDLPQPAHLDREAMPSSSESSHGLLDFRPGA